MLYELNDDEMEILLEDGGFIVKDEYDSLSYKGNELECEYHYRVDRNRIRYELTDLGAARLLFMGEAGVKLDDALDRFLDDLEKSLEVVEWGKVQINNKDHLRKALWRLLK